MFTPVVILAPLWNIYFAPLLLTFKVGVLAVLALLNLTLTLAPASSEKVPFVIETVFAAVAAAVEQVPNLLTVAPVIPSCLIV